MEKLPGYLIGSEYWYLNESERDSIRRAFKYAWLYVLSSSHPLHFVILIMSMLTLYLGHIQRVSEDWSCAFST
jgi:hypothetical protein